MFDLSGMNPADNYTNTIKEISKYFGVKYYNSYLIREDMDTMTKPTIDMPNDPKQMIVKTGIRYMSRAFWKEEINILVKEKKILKEKCKN